MILIAGRSDLAADALSGRLQVVAGSGQTLGNTGFGQLEVRSRVVALLVTNFAVDLQHFVIVLQHEIDDLIKEDTLPTVLKWFRNIDVNYMMPMFKRPMNDAKSAERATEEVEAEQAEGGQEDHFFKA